jgi:hypothetical protein
LFGYGLTSSIQQHKFGRELASLCYLKDLTLGISLADEMAFHAHIDEHWAPENCDNPSPFQDNLDVHPMNDCARCHATLFDEVKRREAAASQILQAMIPSLETVEWGASM